MVNKDVTHPRMRRLIKNPRIVLLDCSLEYKKGESQVSQRSSVIYIIYIHRHISCHTQPLPNFTEHVSSLQTDIEITREEDFARILQMEEEYIQQICEDIIRLKPDLIFTEKGISGTQTHTCSAVHRHGYLLMSCCDPHHHTLM